MNSGEGRNTPEQMGREKQDWKRNAESLTILNPSRGSKNHWNCCGAILMSCMLTASMQRQKRVLALMQKEFLFHELGIQNSNLLL